MKRYAVVDIGTNSARLMVAHTKGRSVVADHKTLRLVRVGEGMTSQRRITQDAMQRTAKALLGFLSISDTFNVDAFYCFATSAVRDAQNSAEFSEYIRRECGLKIDIISGEREALLGFAGSIEGRGGMFDIGGGSTEVMAGSLDHISFQQSFDIGTVRCLQMFPGADDADQKAFLPAHELAAHTFKNIPKAKGFTYTAIGGTATALAAIDLRLFEYDAGKIHGHVLSLEKAESICSSLKRQTAQQRAERFFLEKYKADVIVFGAILFAEFIKAADAPHVIISDSDNLEGYLKFKLGLV